MKMYKESLKDAEKVIELKPDWAKGYLRAGQAHEQLLDYVLANEYYEQGLKLDAEDPTIKQAIENLVRHGEDRYRSLEICICECVSISLCCVCSLASYTG